MWYALAYVGGLVTLPLIAIAGAVVAQMRDPKPHMRPVSYMDNRPGDDLKATIESEYVRTQREGF